MLNINNIDAAQTMNYKNKKRTEQTKMDTIVFRLFCFTFLFASFICIDIVLYGMILVISWSGIDRLLFQ